MYIIILYKSFEKLKRKYIPISWNIPPPHKKRNNDQKFSKVDENYKPDIYEAQKTSHTRNTKKTTSKAHHNQIPQKQ